MMDGHAGQRNSRTLQTTQPDYTKYYIRSTVLMYSHTLLNVIKKSLDGVFLCSDQWSAAATNAIK